MGACRNPNCLSLWASWGALVLDPNTLVSSSDKEERGGAESSARAPLNPGSLWGPSLLLLLCCPQLGGPFLACWAGGPGKGGEGHLHFRET